MFQQLAIWSSHGEFASWQFGLRECLHSEIISVNQHSRGNVFDMISDNLKLCSLAARVFVGVGRVESDGRGRPRPPLQGLRQALAGLWSRVVRSRLGA